MMTKKSRTTKQPSESLNDLYQSLDRYQAFIFCVLCFSAVGTFLGVSGLMLYVAWAITAALTSIHSVVLDRYIGKQQLMDNELSQILKEKR